MNNLTCCWIFAIVLMTIPICLDNWSTLQIDYGATSGICFIEPRLYLIGLFIGPSLFLFFVHAICFIMTTVNICCILPNDLEIAAASDRNMAMIFAKIGGLIGVTWLFALLPYITGIEELWYVFVIMNGLQGVYIFLSSGVIGYFRTKQRTTSTAVQSESCETRHSIHM